MRSYGKFDIARTTLTLLFAQGTFYLWGAAAGTQSAALRGINLSQTQLHPKPAMLHGLTSSRLLNQAQDI